MTKRKSLGFSIFIAVLTVILAASVICTVSVNYIFGSSSKSGRIFGKNIYVMTTDDMLPELENGSAIICEDDEIAVLNTGNVILFRQEEDFENIMRIVEVVHNTDSTVYRVASDSKPEEIYDINKENVIAKCNIESMRLGKIITFLKSVPGILAGMILPCLILLLLIILKIRSVKQNAKEAEEEWVADLSGSRSSVKEGGSNPLFDPSMGVKPDMTFEMKKSSISENFGRKPSAKKNIPPVSENAVEKFRAAVDEKPAAPVTRRPSLAPENSDKNQKMAAIKAALNKQDSENVINPQQESFEKTTAFKIPSDALNNNAKPEVSPIPENTVAQPEDKVPKPSQQNTPKKQDNIHSIDDLIRALEEEKKKL